MAQTHKVTIKNMKYQPDPVPVAAGDAVEWTNQDSMQHTVTADDGTFDSGAVAKNETFTQTFPTQGEVPYHCDFHPGMTGSVVVR